MASGVLASRSESNWGQPKGGFMPKTLIPNPNPNPNSNFHAPKRNQIYSNGGGQIIRRCVDDSPIAKCSPAVSDDSSSLNHKPLQPTISNGNVFNQGGGQYISFNVASCSRKEALDLKNRLLDELERVRTLAARIESGEFGQYKKVLGSKKRPFPEEPKRPLQNAAALMKMCGQVLGKLMKQKGSWVFNEPVDAEQLGLHDYHLIVKNPMDLGTVKSNLAKAVYLSPDEFAADVRLTFHNAMLYNPKGNHVHHMAEVFLAKFENWYLPIYRKLLESSHHQNQNNQIMDNLVSNQVQVRGVGVPQREKVRKTNSLHPTGKKLDGVQAASQQAMPVAEVQSPVVLPTPSSPVWEQAPAQPSLVATKSSNMNAKLPKPKAKDPNKREMTMDEMQRLMLVLGSMPDEKMDQAGQIISQRNELFLNEQGEAELDLGTLDVETLWELDRFASNWKKMVTKVQRQSLMDGGNVVASIGAADDERLGVDEKPEVTTIEKRSKKGEEEDVDIGDELPVSCFPPVEIEKDDGPATSSSSSSSSSSSGSSSSSDSDSGSSSGCDSDAEGVVQSCAGKVF